MLVFFASDAALVNIIVILTDDTAFVNIIITFTDVLFSDSSYAFICFEETS